MRLAPSNLEARAEVRNQSTRLETAERGGGGWLKLVKTRKRVYQVRVGRESTR